MYYTDKRDKLGYLEYQEVVLDNISRVICPQQFIDRNYDFIEHYIFKSYELYNNSKTEDYSINIVVNLLEILLDSMFKYHPETDLPEDLITLS